MKQRIIVAVIRIPLLLAILCVAPDWATTSCGTWTAAVC